MLRPSFAERKSGARIYGPHEQTEANPAQPRERLENAGERHLRRSTDCLGKPVRGGLGADERRNAHGRKKPSSYTSSTSLIISASATSATACTTKISPAGARSTSRVTQTCCCGSRTHGRSSPLRQVNCSRIFANAQNARRSSPVSDIPITEKL